MFKDILVPMTYSDGDDTALSAALQLAEATGAHLTALVTTEMPMPAPSEWGAFPATLYVDLYEEAGKRGAALAARLRARLANAATITEVRFVEGMLLQCSRTAALHARYADLSVMTSAVNSQSHAAVERMFVDLLMSSGRPVLVVPPEPPAALPARHVVIAWQPTRESSRALHDAMPLLRTAETIDILLIDPQSGEGMHGEQPGADIATHLARHGLEVKVVVQPRMGQSISTAILRHAQECGAHLLVAGGYSHARMREQILGGVTRELLAAARVPVLFSH